MLTLVWVIFTLFALLWTGAAALLAQSLQWGVAAVQSGAAAAEGRDLASVPLPPWLVESVDPAWLEPLREAAGWMLTLARDALPYLGPAADWLSLGVWLVWGLGMLFLLLVALSLHLLVRGIAGRTRDEPGQLGPPAA
ncbi:hypothetical protein [Ramlibacter rhizophilus]|uniref:Uncharacterized protein n=1 Tax=Ramlibacter rhizophilus TaxID=1781167 RepID=A0A4Z0BPR2_9BURK|nr:hypothetical protein [Ramlibacter rhizophilus]TFZ01287.1 hypothetical protein EZ242_07850 [Ramlibacter rhizophilus]